MSEDSYRRGRLSRARAKAVGEAARERGETEPAAAYAYACDALVALVTGQPTPRGTDRPGTGTTGTGTTGTDQSGTGSTRRDTITLRVDLDALLRGDVGDGQVCEIPGVGPVPLSLATDLLGEATTGDQRPGTPPPPHRVRATGASPTRPGM